jgi:hypothetical protein
MRLSLIRLLLLLPGSQVLLNSPDHLVAHLRSLCKARAEVALDVFELCAVPLEVTERDAVGPVLHCGSQWDRPSLCLSVCNKTYASSKRELKVVGHVCVIGDGVVNALVQQVLVAVKVLGDTQPETEQLLCVSTVFCQSAHSVSKGHSQVSSKSCDHTAQFPASTSSLP